MILTIGNSGVYEFEAFRAVVDALERRGSGAMFFKQDRCLDGESLRYEARNDHDAFFVRIDGTWHDVDSFSGIWLLKPHLPKALLEFKPEDKRWFIDRQFAVMRRALWSIYSHKRWLSDPFAMDRAENKIVQLRAARTVDLQIPDTVITSDPDEVRTFAAIHPLGIVVKPLAVVPMLGQVIYTNRLTEAHLARIDSVRSSPAIFQALVPKAYELRITIVGDRMFAARIWSQDDAATALDWRREPALNDYRVRMAAVEIPADVERRLRVLLDALGLRFGCIDMIVTPGGEYVFLEVNPNGQWYFVQLKTGEAIAEAIAELLTTDIQH